ncbi:MAG: Hint domain-containing protein [Verrucomicrobia bacterium]|nr:Hint domain-containing protein [Verrucomicrobiota bacterium]MDA1006177.1 Hint domain-containing protein [Verrucomicrobiota bacterium]
MNLVFSPLNTRAAALGVLLGAGVLLLGGCSLFNTVVGVGLVKLRFGCLVEGTLIDTPEGPVAVEDLETGAVVIGYAGVPVVVRQVHQYREDPALLLHLTVRFEEGAAIQLSRRHRIEGVAAEELRVGDEVGLRVVSAVDSLGGVTRSYDLLTEDAGYRIGGIPVNSMIEEMAGDRS